MSVNKTVIKEYFTITISIILMVLGTCIFKFPNNFSFGGITGYATIVSRLTPMSLSTFTIFCNFILVILGFIFLGKGFGLKTVYASFIFSVGIKIFENYNRIPLPLTNQPFLELLFAILIPGVGSAILFNIGASSGGTDIVAMMLKKYTPWHIGTVLFLVDFVSVIMAFIVFSPETGLFSMLGLLCKSLIINSVIESVNLCKCFTIICENPEPICDYIINQLNRSATTYNATGAYKHHNKTIVLTTMKRTEALKLRTFIREESPNSFMIITSSSEIIGKGFISI